MFGYESLTRVVYVLLVVAFVAVISYMFWYNLRVRRRTRELEGSTHQHYGTEEGIAAGTEAEHQARLHHHEH
ncbi:MAG TPA: hypothetical protein VFA99_05950 [Acidobacteriaceae bacterium]|nr:hypothetical protein [Acidobacteriaceae bacterium]